VRTCFVGPRPLGATGEESRRPSETGLRYLLYDRGNDDVSVSEVERIAI
jgi:hypothetical protein